MVSSDPPSANSRSGFESLFRHAFTTDRYVQFNPTATPTSMPNEACGDTLQPDFDGMYVWSNNVNTLSLTNDLSDLHELCRQFKHYNIGIAALQELNIDMTQTAIYRRVQAVLMSISTGSVSWSVPRRRSDLQRTGNQARRSWWYSLCGPRTSSKSREMTSAGGAL